MPLLATLLRSDNLAVQEKAAGTLSNLSAVSQQHRGAIIAAGAVPLLIAWLRSDKPALQKQAASALEHLAAGSQQNKVAVIAAGVCLFSLHC